MTRRGRGVVAALAVACLAASFALAGAARAPGAGLASDRVEPDRAVEVATPLWSARRVPALVARRAAAPLLESELAAVLSGHDACAATTDGDVRTVAGGPEARTPASTLKLLTGAAALDVLGPAHRFRTEVRGPAGTSGTVPGDLVLVGGGDPGLATPAGERALAARDRFATVPVTRLADLADAVVAAGVQRVEGSILGDDARHERVRYLPAWKPNYRTEGQSGPLGALAVDQGFDPPGTALAAGDPAQHAASELVALLAERGVVVTGGAARRPDTAAPADLPLVASVESAPLDEIVAGAVAASDNYAAELLVREIGVAKRDAGTTAAGTAAVLETVEALGVPTDGAIVLDGSGLAPGNRLTCESVLAALRLGARPGLEALDRGLAIAGRTGTLAARLLGDPLEGVLRAKTGQLAGVVGLAGTVDDGDGMTFTFLAGGDFSMAGGQQLQADVAHVVARYPSVEAGTLPPVRIAAAPGR